MQKKIHYYFSLGFIVVCLCTGLIMKHLHKDIEDDINDFYVGLIDDELVDAEINYMRHSLNDSKYILLVTCESGMKFNFSYGSQQVRVDSVIKSEGDVSQGDTIDIVKIDTVYIPDDEQFGSLNYGFVNELKSGNKYIVFLEQKVIEDEKNVVFLYNSDYFISPYFNVDGIKASPCVSSVEEGCFAKYNDVKENDVFFMSSGAIDKWNILCEETARLYLIDN
ncbi:MAG: hypothetical protein ACI39Q_05455 [Wujia sp.]